MTHPARANSTFLFGKLQYFINNLISTTNSLHPTAGANKFYQNLPETKVASHALGRLLSLALLPIGNAKHILNSWNDYDNTPAVSYDSPSGP